MALLAAGRAADALGPLGRAAAAGDAAASCHLARALLELDRPEEALGAAQQALRTAPASCWALRLCSICHRRLGQAPNAVEAATAAVAGDPSDWLNHLVAADALHAAGRLTDAAAAAATAMSLAPTEAAPCAAAARAAVARRRYREAIGHAQRGLALDPSSVDARYQLGMALHATGRHRQAAEVLASVAGDQPQARYWHQGLRWASARVIERSYAPATVVVCVLVLVALAGGWAVLALVLIPPAVYWGHRRYRREVAALPRGARAAVEDARAQRVDVRRTFGLRLWLPLASFLVALAAFLAGVAMTTARDPIVVVAGVAAIIASLLLTGVALRRAASNRRRVRAYLDQADR